ncbi:MAG: replication initiator protein [Microviridae sp.]|nr:MAG: replication initiator protein [Microviridae sp.]
MICDNPISTSGGLWSCGQCLPCRYNKRRLWSHRIELECTQHEHNTFLTLTYADDKLPGNGSLEPSHLRDFLKRLRKFYGYNNQEGRVLRYFAVGEYGGLTFRPHYHLALFGHLGCEWQQTRLRKDQQCCQRCSDVKRIWGYGNVFLGTMEKSAQYICGYVVKKMTRRDDPRLQGRYPEFARMSLKPGIGAFAMDDVASDMMQSGVSDAHDVSAISYGARRVKPLGVYLTRRLRKLRGLDEKAPQSVLDKVQAEVLPLRLAARQDEKDPSVKSKFLQHTKGKSRSMKARAGLFGKKHEAL